MNHKQLNDIVSKLGKLNPEDQVVYVNQQALEAFQSGESLADLAERLAVSREASKLVDDIIDEYLPKDK